MQPLEGAVYPLRVQPPTWAERHPRLSVAVRPLPWLILTMLMVDRLRTEGFTWFAVIGLVIFAFNLGYHVSKLERRDLPSESKSH